MGKDGIRPYMKLDVLKKTSNHHGAKARTMGLMSKIGIFYRFGRINKGLLLLLFMAYLVYRGMIEEAEIDFAIAMGFSAVTAIVAFLFLYSGIRRMMRTISIIEYGTKANATVSGFREWRLRRSRWTGPGTIGSIYSYTTYKHGCIICKYNDSSGKSHTLQFFFHNIADQIKKGDHFQVIYDPGMPGNAIAVDALPRFVRTSPAL